jgi:hypothetical protein
MPRFGKTKCVVVRSGGRGHCAIPNLEVNFHTFSHSHSAVLGQCLYRPALMNNEHVVNLFVFFLVLIDQIIGGPGTPILPQAATNES